MRDGAPALGQLAARDIRHERPGEAPVIQAAVAVEPAVLDRDDRILHALGNAIQGNRLPVLGRQLGEELAVGGVDLRSDRGAIAVERGIGWQHLVHLVKGAQHHPHPRSHHEDEQHLGPEQDLLDAAPGCRTEHGPDSRPTL